MTRVLLLRHGATDLVATTLCGRTPGIHLNRPGRDQAEALATRLEHKKASAPDLLVTSPIERARETAEAIARRTGLTPQVDPGFAEVDFGAWTGQSFEELRGNPEWQRFNSERETMKPPGGESMADVQTRALAALLPWRGPGGTDRTIAIVSHGDVIRSILLHASGCALREYWRLTIDLASISEIGVDDEGNSWILRVNDTAHLEDKFGQGPW